MRRAILPVVGMLVAVAGNAAACVMEPPQAPAGPREVARVADIVAIIHVDRIEPLTAEEQAETQRLFTTPSDGPIHFPGPSVHFSVRRALKGHVAAGALLRNGATSCEAGVQEGGDYLLFARQPASPGDRIVPMDGTFRLDETGPGAATLAAVESSLTLPDLTHP